MRRLTDRLEACSMPRARRARRERKRRKEPEAAAARPRRRRRSRRSALGPQAAKILALAVAFAGGCSRADAPEPAAPVARVAEGPHEVAVLAMGDLGEIRFELLPEPAPATVESFKHLASLGYYDGTTFHRVIPGFRIQGGDPNTRNHDPRDDGLGGSEFTLKDEFTTYPHLRGTVSMAHHGHPNTAGSQFFILHGDATFLDGHHTAFGRVTQGMDVVDRIAALPIDKYGRYGPRDRPYPKAAVVESVRILPAGASEPAAAPTPIVDAPAPAAPASSLQAGVPRLMLKGADVD